MLIVTQKFVGHGYNMPSIGDLIDPREPERSAILAAGVAAEYEVKVVPLPVEKKNERHLEL